MPYQPNDWPPEQQALAYGLVAADLANVCVDVKHNTAYPALTKAVTKLRRVMDEGDPQLADLWDVMPRIVKWTIYIYEQQELHGPPLTPHQQAVLDSARRLSDCIHLKTFNWGAGIDPWGGIRAQLR